MVSRYLETSWQVSSQKPHTDIGHKLPPTIMQANAFYILTLDVFQNQLHRNNFLIQYRSNDFTIYDQEVFKKINSFKVSSILSLFEIRANWMMSVTDVGAEIC